jgi:hypothetical protein
LLLTRYQHRNDYQNGKQQKEPAKRQRKLPGMENYLAWKTRLETLLSIDEVIKRNATTGEIEIAGAAAVKPDNEKKAKKYLIQNCDDCVMHAINPEDNFIKILAKLNDSYGFGSIDPSIILNQLRDIRFHPSKDPAIVLNEIDIRLAELNSSGGTITDDQVVQYIHDGLSGDSLRDNFWYNCKGNMSMVGLSKYTVETAGQYIVKFWYSYKPKLSAEKANSANNKKKTHYEKRFCEHCSNGDRQRIMKTHNTADCRIHKCEAANKAAQNYSPPDLYHDSGTSKTMVNYPPPIAQKSTLSQFTQPVHLSHLKWALQKAVLLRFSCFFTPL